MQAKLHTRSDRHLQDSVMQQLEWDPEIASQDISVSAKDGAVTLTGFVHSYLEKVAAEKAAKSVYGVKGVANDIEVKPATRTDPEITRDVVEALRIDALVPDNCIKAAISDGFVTLEGMLDWNFQREAAERCAKNVSGIRGIRNRIQLKPRVSPVEVKTKIEDAIRRSAVVDSRKITVSASDGTITLEGNVRSWFERKVAEGAAWAAPGVTKVIDHIAVVP
jgi:osmotically-inducible protein OsmY